MPQHGDGGRPLDEWVEMFERIYFYTQNHERSIQQIHLRVYEAGLNLQKSAIKRRDYELSKTKWLPKLFAWYCALLRALRIGGVSSMVWRKFPAVCPFCLQPLCSCAPGVAKPPLDRSALAALAKERQHLRPIALADWQTLFDSIYRQAARGPTLRSSAANITDRAVIETAFLKFFEELTEVVSSPVK